MQSRRKPWLLVLQLPAETGRFGPVGTIFANYFLPVRQQRGQPAQTAVMPVGTLLERQRQRQRHRLRIRSVRTAIDEAEPAAAVAPQPRRLAPVHQHGQFGRVHCAGSKRTARPSARTTCISLSASAR